MSKIFSKTGGVAVAHMKNTKDCVPVKMPAPEKVLIPMRQNMGAECEPVVKPGDLVKIGDVLGNTDAFIGAPVHSSVSGKVAGIEEFIGADGNVCKAVLITNDGENAVSETVKAPSVSTKDEFVAAVRASGLVGMGGAGFPTHVKLCPKNPESVKTLLLNGAECEPYITADFRTMLDRAEDVVYGATKTADLLGLTSVVIGIEDNKPEAVKKLGELTASDSRFKIVSLASFYPQGGEKQLINALTGNIVPEGGLPADVGCIVMNVTTAAFIGSYLKTGMPVTEKCITVDGDAVNTPQNIIVPIGSSVEAVKEFAGGLKSKAKKVLSGGPMMGTALRDLEYPVQKTCNALLFFTEASCKDIPESACIRCARCVAVCPMKLMPAGIDRAYHAEKIDSLRSLKVNLCIECGSCSYVCPAKRNLVASIKLSKNLVRTADKK